LTTALAATIGTGNIVGVATAQRLTKNIRGCVRSLKNVLSNRSRGSRSRLR